MSEKVTVAAVLTVVHIEPKSWESRSKITGIAIQNRDLPHWDLLSVTGHPAYACFLQLADVIVFSDDGLFFGSFLVKPLRSGIHNLAEALISLLNPPEQQAMITRHEIAGCLCRQIHQAFSNGDMGLNLALTRPAGSRRCWIASSLSELNYEFIAEAGSRGNREDIHILAWRNYSCGEWSSKLRYLIDLASEEWNSAVRSELVAEDRASSEEEE
ncbi:hypothetical protein TIFTF001_036186 [Ficus carica]|uniref:Uncharacterized protein n=1 Tax=Ficus carica TaxID=3494 RepID=A0AA88E3V0_FICCA|nr:hypothetical protein TIFTF001_036186 [Ficus carica]